MAIFIGSTPNITEDDLKTAKGIVEGITNVKGSREKLKQLFQEEYPGKQLYFFNRGREGIYFFLRNMNLQPNDEVILQGFTCIAVVAPILWLKGIPVFVDISRDTLNMDINKVKEKITLRTKSIIAQHTFGNIADIKKLRKIVDEENRKREEGNKITLLEDCAHILDFKNKEIGKHSDAFLFSFAQDKSVSSTQGALLVINNKEILCKDVNQEYSNVPELTQEDALYNAKYILYWERIKRYYFKKILIPKITIGKILLVWYRFTGKIRKQASSNTQEFDGIHKISDIQAKLLLIQLQSLEKFNENRKEIAKIYGSKSENILLRYPILVKNPKEVKEKLRDIGVISGSWYSTPVFPISWNNLGQLGYKVGKYPEVEFCCKHIVNLPTSIQVTKNIAKQITEIVKNYAKHI